MKTLLVITACFLYGITYSAIDTLTYAQIYNFNVGDTFDYRINVDDVNTGFSYINYSRKVVTEKTYSINSDTLYIKYAATNGAVLNTDTITNMNEQAVYSVIDSSYEANCSRMEQYDITTYPGYTSNELIYSCFESGSRYRFTEGLGRTQYCRSAIGNNGSGCNCYSEEMVYYSNGVTRVGTPYTVLNGSSLVRFTPLPEECAVWTRTVTGSVTPGSPIGTITEQIRTGNKTVKNGHTYVEMICRIYNGFNGHFTNDSLVGYFYNDSANKRVLFVQDTNASMVYSLCNFNYSQGTSCGPNGHFQLTQVLIGGVFRTKWECTSTSPYAASPFIEGIGYLTGLIEINKLYSNFTAGPEHGDLTCFSVCGKTLYPQAGQTACPLLTGIDDVDSDISQFNLIPNPALTSVEIKLSNEFLNTTLTITDLTGRVLLQQKLEVEETSVSINELPAGIYLATVISPDGRAATQKLIKE